MVETSKNGIEYMSSPVLAAFNVFSTRSGGVSTGDFSSLNLGSNRGDDPDCVGENYRRFCALFGVDENSAAVTKQVHGNNVRVVNKDDRHICFGTVPYEADGIVTAEKGLPLFCFTADCVPALLCDRKLKTAAAVHCGWRSSVADILGVTIEEMKKLGADAADICCALGPAIGPCCFECDGDVIAALEAYIGREAVNCYTERSGKFMVDLRKANAVRLMQLGLRRENIDISTECTMCFHDKYWSHRYTIKNGLGRGSQASGIML